jgi:hypothetical protein
MTKPSSTNSPKAYKSRFVAFSARHIIPIAIGICTKYQVRCTKTELKIFSPRGDCHRNYLPTGRQAWYSKTRRPSAGVPPLPIPNREVKPCSADGTGVTPGRVGRRHIIKKPALKAGFWRLCGNQEARIKRQEARSKRQEARRDLLRYGY